MIKPGKITAAIGTALFLNLIGWMVEPGVAFGQGPRTHRSAKTSHMSALRFEDPSSRLRISPDAFLDQYGQQLGVRTRQALEHKGRKPDQLGNAHDTYEQRHKGVPVFGGVLKVHRDADNSIYAANGDVFDIPDDLDTTPALTADEARQRAFEALGAADATLLSSSLVVVDPAWYGNPPRGVHLTYFLKVAPAEDKVFALFIDAETGEVLDHWDDVPSAMYREVHDAHDGGDLCPPVSLPGATIRAEGDAAAEIDDINRIYDYSGDFYRFLQRGFGRDSIDGLGTPLVAIARANGVLDCPDASFVSSPIAAGVFCAGVAADDTVAHEFTHGLIVNTADLLYQNESGMLNESFADIFGEVVDLLNGNAVSPGPPGGLPSWPAHATGPGTDFPNNPRGTACSFPPNYAAGMRWLHAEDSLAYGGPIRDMWHPACFGNPERVSELEFCKSSPRERVHSGSGVGNHAFAIVTDGKTFNGQLVTGIGLVKATAVWYRALTVYLTPLSRFRDAAVALDMAASDLIGTRPLDPRTGQPGALFTATDRIQVTAAAHAVEMDQVTQWSDQDGDGAPNECDNCPLVSNPDQADSDVDTKGDVCDDCVDVDHDGFGEPGYPASQCGVDNCKYSSNPNQADADHDGVGDACEDPDGDGFVNSWDNCDLQSNSTQGDADLDKIGDECDACTDMDGDGFGDPTFPGTCAPDNCPTIPNPAQTAACAAAPLNDRCGSATPIGHYFSGAVDTRTATTEFGEPHDSGLGATIWYRFTAPKAGRVCAAVRPETAFAAQIDLFPSSACTFAAAPFASEIEDLLPGCGKPELEFDVEQGETRYLRVGQRDWLGDVNGNGGDLSFSVEYLTPCLGDCEGDGDVEADELNKAISVATGARPMSYCAVADRDGDSQVTIDELLAITNRALNGCPDVCDTATGSSAQPRFEVWSATGHRGYTISFPLVIEGASSEMAAFNVDLQYPSNVITTPVCSKDPRLPHGHVLQSRVLSANTVRFLLADTSTFPSPTFADGVVLSCQAQIKSNAPYGSHPIQATRTTISSAFGDRLASTVSSGTIVVLAPGGGGTCNTTDNNYVPSELLIVIVAWLAAHLRRTSRRRTGGAHAAALVVALALSTALAVQAQEESGVWARLDGRKRLTTLRGVNRTWHVTDVEVAGPRSVTGRVAVVGASFMSLGHFEATVSETGAITGDVWSIDNGKPVARIDGAFDGQRFAGVFVADNGERGEWAWSLSDPRKLSAILQLNRSKD